MFLGRLLLAPHLHCYIMQMRRYRCRRLRYRHR